VLIITAVKEACQGRTPARTTWHLFDPNGEYGQGLRAFPSVRRRVRCCRSHRRITGARARALLPNERGATVGVRGRQPVYRAVTR
jgi:hypothetical protein